MSIFRFLLIYTHCTKPTTFSWMSTPVAKRLKTTALPSFANNVNPTKSKPQIVVIAGPTAIGKSSLAYKLASSPTSRHIISVDSVQAYKHVQIGSNKPSPSDLLRTPQHLISVVDPDEKYTAADFRNNAIATISQIEQSEPDQERILVVGGTMMYIDWLLKGTPDAPKTSDEAISRATEMLAKFQQNDEKDWPGAVEFVVTKFKADKSVVDRVGILASNDWYRLRRILEIKLCASETDSDDNLFTNQRKGALKELGYDVRCFFLCPTDRKTHCHVVDERCEDMLIEGLIGECCDLVLEGKINEEGQVGKAIGYRQVLSYLRREKGEGEVDGEGEGKEGDFERFGEMLNEFCGVTRRYAKKQMAWFRKEEEFYFVPVGDRGGEEEGPLETIERLCAADRETYEREVATKGGEWKKNNEEQSKEMRTYVSRAVKLVKGSEALAKVLEEANGRIKKIRSKGG